MMDAPQKETAKGAATPMAVISGFDNLNASNPNLNAGRKASLSAHYDDALWLCRRAALNPFLRGAVLARWGELLAIGHAMNGGGHVR